MTINKSARAAPRFPEFAEMAGQSQIHDYIDCQWTPSPPWKLRAVIYDTHQEELLNKGIEFLKITARPTPDRLVCLFHGPTGTGKSVFAKYLAKTLDLSIYNVVPSLDNDDLKAALETVPGRCVVLIEDADTITPNALPSFLDSVSSLGDGRIIILTTRHFQQLDDVLKDPGLVNQTIEFQLADRNRIALLFQTTFPDSEEEDRAAFTTKMPDLYLSLAEVQSHLINSRSPKASVRDAEQWLASIKDERENLRHRSGHTPPC